jgi:hypothetical protein
MTASAFVDRLKGNFYKKSTRLSGLCACIELQKALRKCLGEIDNCRGRVCGWWKQKKEVNGIPKKVYSRLIVK